MGTAAAICLASTVVAIGATVGVAAADDDEISSIQTVTDNDGSVDGLDGSQGLAVSPDGKHAYATGSFDDAVVALSRSAADGELAFLAAIFDGAGAVTELDSARGVAVSPDGKHVYVASLLDNSVTAFSRSSVTGLLTFVEAEKDSAGGVDGLAGAHGVTVSPDGKHVYVASRSEDAVAVFSRTAATGALAFVETEKDGVGGVDGLNAAEGVTVSPDGEFVYVAGEDDNAVAVFDRDTTTGALTFVEAKFDGVGGVSGLVGSNSVTISPDGKHLYVSGEFDDDTLGDDDLGAVFSRNQVDGTLTFVEEIPPFLDNTGDFDCIGVSGGGGLAVNFSGDRVYVSESWHSALLVFSRRASTGRLTLLEAHCEFLTSLGNVNVVAVSPNDLNVYTTGLDGVLTTFAAICNGTIATLIGTDGDNNLVGTSGVDVIQARGGNDTVQGLGSDDTICGDGGDDTIRGGGGNDTIIGGTGNDTLRGNAGNDTVDYSGAPAAVTVKLGPQTATGGHGSDSVKQVENIIGTPFADTLFGNVLANRIEGGAGSDELRGNPGNDELIGQGGNDVLRGGPGNDDLTGNAGTDTADYTGAPGAVTVRLAAGTASGGHGSDTIASVENIVGSSLADTLQGNGLANKIEGSGGRDDIRGNAGHDTLIGQGGNDDIAGGGGDDSLFGNGGTDTANGGPGTDTCFAETKISCE